MDYLDEPTTGVLSPVELRSLQDPNPEYDDSILEKEGFEKITLLGMEYVDLSGFEGFYACIGAFVFAINREKDLFVHVNSGIEATKLEDSGFKFSLPRIETDEYETYPGGINAAQNVNLQMTTHTLYELFKGFSVFDKLISNLFSVPQELEAIYEKQLGMME